MIDIFIFEKLRFSRTNECRNAQFFLRLVRSEVGAVVHILFCLLEFLKNFKFRTEDFFLSREFLFKNTELKMR